MRQIFKECVSGFLAEQDILELLGFLADNNDRKSATLLAPYFAIP